MNQKIGHQEPKTVERFIGEALLMKNKQQCITRCLPFLEGLFVQFSFNLSVAPVLDKVSLNLSVAPDLDKEIGNPS